MPTTSVHRRAASLRRAILIALLITIFPHCACAQEPTVVVLYPETAKPYSDVFQQILAGVASHATVHARALPRNYDAVELRRWLENDAADAQAIVALGQRGLRAAGDIGGVLPVIAGAVVALSTQEMNHPRFSVISLVPDPARLFAHLRHLAPAVRRVILVHDAHNGEWLMPVARKAADAEGLQLVVHNASDLRTAAQTYRQVLDRSAGRTDALWLPMDPVTMEDDTILPLVLSQAWEREIVVFSANPAHVEKGILFAMFPDNRALGRSLAIQALRRASGQNSTLRIAPLTDLLTALNLRTASHLGLQTSPQQERGYDLLFPARQ